MLSYHSAVLTLSVWWVSCFLNVKWAFYGSLHIAAPRCEYNYEYVWCLFRTVTRVSFDWNPMVSSPNVSTPPPHSFSFTCYSINHSSQAKVKGCHQGWHLGASRPTHPPHPSRTSSSSWKIERKNISSERHTNRFWDCQKTARGDSGRLTTEWPWAAPEHKDPGAIRKLSAWECCNGWWLLRET